MRGILTVCAALLLMSTQAHALCRDDLKELKPRIERIKDSDKERYALANKWWGRASEIERTSELECRTYYLRASKALSQPLVEINNCQGPNAQLPQCNPAARGGAAGVGAMPGGGDGAAQTFSPPGSLGSPYK